MASTPSTTARPDRLTARTAMSRAASTDQRGAHATGAAEHHVQGVHKITGGVVRSAR
jgi:hypothetical protein